MFKSLLNYEKLTLFTAFSQFSDFEYKSSTIASLKCIASDNCPPKTSYQLKAKDNLVQKYNNSEFCVRKKELVFAYCITLFKCLNFINNI